MATLPRFVDPYRRLHPKKPHLWFRHGKWEVHEASLRSVVSPIIRCEISSRNQQAWLWTRGIRHERIYS